VFQRSQTYQYAPFDVMGDKMQMMYWKWSSILTGTIVSMFCLPTDADGIIEIDFLTQPSAKLDSEKKQLKLLDFPNYNQGSLYWRAREATRTTDPVLYFLH